MARSNRYKNHKKRVSKRRKTPRFNRSMRKSTSRSTSYLFNGGQCASCMTPLTQAGIAQAGGNFNANTVNQSIIPFNNLIGTGGDPLAPTNIISASNLPNIINKGGRSRRSSKCKRSSKMKGGSISSSISDFLLGASSGATANPMLSIGSSINAPLSTTVASGLPFVNPATHIQPSLNVFSNTNPPLV